VTDGIRFSFPVKVPDTPAPPSFLARRVSAPAAFKTQLGQQNRLNQQGVEQGALAALELAEHC